MAERKVRPHNRIAQLLLSGEVVSPEAIHAAFDGDQHMLDLMYRLSVYIYDIRKYDNGTVQVIKDGRTVSGYKLLNADLFDMQGRYTGLSRVAIAQSEWDSWFVDVAFQDGCWVSTGDYPMKPFEPRVVDVPPYVNDTPALDPMDPAADMMLGDDDNVKDDAQAVSVIMKEKGRFIPLAHVGAVALSQPPA